MAGHLPGVRDLRLHPNERPVDMGAQWNLGGDAVAEQRARSSEQVHEKTVSFKDLATLVAVVLDRKDAIDRAGAGVCERTQGACACLHPAGLVLLAHRTYCVPSLQHVRRICSCRHECVANRRCTQSTALHANIRARRFCKFAGNRCGQGEHTRKEAPPVER